MKKIKKLKDFVEGTEEQDEVIKFDECLHNDGKWIKEYILDVGGFEHVLDISHEEDDFKLYLCWNDIKYPVLFRKWKEGKK